MNLVPTAQSRLEVGFPTAPPRSHWAGKPPEQRVRWRDGMFIPYPRLRTVINDVTENIAYTSMSERSSGMFLVMGTGGGKTTLANFLRTWTTTRYSRDLPEKTVTPALILKVPKPCTAPELCFSILEALGDPFPRRRRSSTRADGPSLVDQTSAMLRSCETRLVVLDNAQDVPAARRRRGMEQLSVPIRDLIDATSLVWLFLGTESAHELIRSDPERQLIRRFAYQAEIPYFRLGDPEKAADFMRLLAAIDKWLPLEESSLRVMSEASGTIYFATEGILERLCSILGRASWEAACARRTSLSLDDLKNAFAFVFGCQPNPFEGNFVLRRLDRRGEPYEVLAKSRSDVAKKEGA